MLSRLVQSMAYMGGWESSHDVCGTDNAALVEPVTTFRRTSPAHKETRYAFCKEKSVFDPNRQRIDVMKDRLVEEVKNFQRIGPANKEAWYTFCRERSSQGDKDPNRYDADVLIEFLMNVKAGKGIGKGGASWNSRGNGGQWNSIMMMQMMNHMFVMQKINQNQLFAMQKMNQLFVMSGKGMGKMGGMGKGRSKPY